MHTETLVCKLRSFLVKAGDGVLEDCPLTDESEALVNDLSNWLVSNGHKHVYNVPLPESPMFKACACGDTVPVTWERPAPETKPYIVKGTVEFMLWEDYETVVRAVNEREACKVALDRARTHFSSISVKDASMDWDEHSAFSVRETNEMVYDDFNH